MKAKTHNFTNSNSHNILFKPMTNLNKQNLEKHQAAYSASKVMKNFEQSLRNYDSSSIKKDDLRNSSKKHSTSSQGVENNEPNILQKIYYVDVTKKIKKVSNPFQLMKLAQTHDSFVITPQINMYSPSPDISFDYSKLKQEFLYEEIEIKLEDMISKIPYDQHEIQDINSNENQFEINAEILKINELCILNLDIIPEKYYQLSNLNEQNKQENIVPNSFDSQMMIQKQIAQNVRKINQQMIKSIKYSKIWKYEKRDKGWRGKLKKKIQKSIIDLTTQNYEKLSLFLEAWRRKKLYTSQKQLSKELNNQFFGKKFNRLRKELKRLL